MAAVIGLLEGIGNAIIRTVDAVFRLATAGLLLSSAVAIAAGSASLFGASSLAFLFGVRDTWLPVAFVIAIIGAVIAALEFRLVVALSRRRQRG